MTSSVHLNLGCGNDPRPGMLNVDRRGAGADSYMDASDLAIGDRCVSRLQAYHLVEHLGWVGCTYAFCEWFRVMRPGALLVLETPDLPESARRFAGAGMQERALLASWIYGKESPGMQHLFGFEFDLLESMLRSCGFVRIRKEAPLTHLHLPGLRVTAHRGARMSQEVHARFKRLLRVRGLAPDDQDLAVELHEDVAHDLVRTLERVRRDGAATHALMARLVVHDPEIARAALDASAPLLPESVVGRWREILADPEVLLFPRALTGAILSRTPAPGGMQATFTGLRDAARRHLRERGLHRTPRTPPPGPPHTLIEVRPFSPAGLVHAAQEQQGHGLRAFVRGDLLSAERHLEIAAAFNSNLPVIFWNLSRIALARGQRELAVRRIEGALQAARSTKSDLLTSLEREHDSLVSRRPLPTTLVSPVQP